MTVSIAEGNRRLLALAKFLEKLPAEKFIYDKWHENSPSCGTRACALGWAASMPMFRRLGLNTDRQGVPALVEERGKLWGTRAAELLFRLTQKQAEFLFIPGARYGRRLSPPDNATAAQVAAHIRRFVTDRSSTGVRQSARGGRGDG